MLFYVINQPQLHFSRQVNLERTRTSPSSADSVTLLAFAAAHMLLCAMLLWRPRHGTRWFLLSMDISY